MASLGTLLKQTDTNKYFIEYNGGLSNHIAHAIYALHSLGCDVTRIQRFIDWYRPKLEAPSRYPDDQTAGTLEELLGKRHSFYRIRDIYTKRLREHHSDDVTALVRAEFPLLAAGVCGAAFHGLIQLGYGFAAGSSDTVVEGLAYLCFASAPLADHAKLLPPTANPGTEDAAAVLSDLRTDRALSDNMKAGVDEFKDLISTYQRRVCVLYAHYSQELITYVNRIKLPVKLCDHMASGDVVILVTWLLDTAILVYSSTKRPNDFFLLHGVTGSWSLFQVAHLLDSRSAVHAVRATLAGLLATYLAQDSEELVTVATDNVDTSPAAWQSLISDAVREDRDEHVYKLIQVCKQRSDVTEDQAVRQRCVYAARCVLRNPLTFQGTDANYPVM